MTDWIFPEEMLRLLRRQAEAQERTAKAVERLLALTEARMKQEREEAA